MKHLNVEINTISLTIICKQIVEKSSYFKHQIKFSKNYEKKQKEN